MLSRLDFLNPGDFQAIARFPQPNQDDILRIVAQQLEAFVERPADHTGNAYICRCLFELVKLAFMRKEPQASSTPAISKSNLAKLQTLCGVLETKPDWYLNNLLGLHLDDILNRRVGELEGTTLLYDSLAEAKRVTAACDAFDRKVHEWSFAREGRKWAACNSGSYKPFEIREAA